jgi:hypothetical protein
MAETPFHSEEMGFPDPEKEATIADHEQQPDTRQGGAAELYSGFADEIENHPNYDARKDIVVPFDVSLNQFVAYCRERAEENYTNETMHEAEERFRKYLALLER